MPDWIRDHWVLITWLSSASLLLFVLSLVLVPLYLVRMPADALAAGRRPSRWLLARPRWQRVALRVLKNALAVLLIVGGVAMLALPGQGLLTLLLGVLLLDFPGRARVQQWLITRPRVIRPINWLRRKARKEPLVLFPPPPYPPQQRAA
ncbi:MAG TPA: hypothetical protein VD997_05095 [Phycisphaerales bacterium]|nr:hypothetical protein [Phycisphaerales bacterium]